MEKYRYHTVALLILVILQFTFSSTILFAQKADQTTWMQYREPEEAGFSSPLLSEAYNKFNEMNTSSFMVIYRGKVLVAWGDVSRRYMAHSIRKSFMSAMYGIYVDRGEIDLAKTLGDLGIDDIQGLTPHEKKATVLNLITARSGVYHPAAYEPGSMNENRPERGSSKPGETFFYNNWDFNTLVTILEQEVGINFFDDFTRKIADPLGFEDLRPEDMYFRREPQKSKHPAYLFKISAKDLARFGQLYLDKGRWNGKQIISNRWIDRTTKPFSKDLGDFAGREGYGYLWWTDSETFGEPVFFASGLGGHRLYVLPSSDIVIVHQVNSYLGLYQNNGIETLVRMVMDARITKDKAAPKLTELEFEKTTYPDTSIEKQILQKYEGEYRHPFFGEILARVINDKLQLSGNILGHFNLFAKDEQNFVVEDLPELPLRFEKAANPDQKGKAVTSNGPGGRPEAFILYY